MNWKNMFLENGFVRQELKFNGANATNYIPLKKVDSFGIVSSENKRWLYAGVLIIVLGAASMFSHSNTPFVASLILGAFSIFAYFWTKQTWFKVTSNQTIMSYQIKTSPEELKLVNAFIDQMKHQIETSEQSHLRQVA